MRRDRRWLWLAGALTVVLGALAWGIPLATLIAVAALLACPAAMFFGMGMMGRTQGGGTACRPDTPGNADDEMSSTPVPGPRDIAPPPTPPQRQAGPAPGVADGDPMLILKRRLAAGQITLEEYERLAVVLGGMSSLPAGAADEPVPHAPN
jgi:hypothetical protein